MRSSAGPAGPPRATARARDCSSVGATAQTASAETTPRAAFADVRVGLHDVGEEGDAIARGDEIEKPPQEHRRAGAFREGGEHASPRLGAQPRVLEGVAQLRVTGEERHERAQLVTQGDRRLLSLAGSGVEEGPGVAPRQRADGARHGRSFRSGGAAAHTVLGMALGLASMVRAGGRPGGAQERLVESARGYHGPAFTVKDARRLVYKEPSYDAPPSGAPGGSFVASAGPPMRQSPWKNAPSSMSSFGETRVASTRQPESSSMRWRPCT